MTRGIITGKRKRVRRAEHCICGEPLPPLSVQHEDPYCTTECCQNAHGVKHMGVPIPRVRMKA